MRKSVTLECSAINVNKSITRLDYQWQKEFVDISGASKNTYETLEPGSYRCKITNGYRTVYTQDAIVTLEPIWVTDIIINTQSITNSGKIQYTINPEEADDKTITFDVKITPDYTIDAAGNVTINTDGCIFEVVARSQFGKNYSEVTDTKTITGYNSNVEPTGDYFIAKTARGNKTGRRSWDNATDDIKTFDYDGSGVIELGNTYIETGKFCDVDGKYLDFNGNVIGGCEVGSFVPKSNNDRSDFHNIGSFYGIDFRDISAIVTNCDFHTINNDVSYGVGFGYASAIIINCDFYNISGGTAGIDFSGPYSNNTSAIITNCDFYNINGDGYGINFRNASAIITNCDYRNISGGFSGVYFNHVSATIENCAFYNIRNDSFNCIDFSNASAIITNCDFYNISGDGSWRGIDFSNASAIITNCDFYNISGDGSDNTGWRGIDFSNASVIITNCDFHNISGDGDNSGFYGIEFYRTSATIENCTFSAIESNDSTNYTPYSDLIKILPPETGCKFLPEGKAQSIRFNSTCIINGKKVSDLLNS